MAFNLKIDTGNAAFGDDQHEAAAEVARILRDVATSLERGTMGAPLHDYNGNAVGRYDLNKRGR